MTLPIHEEIGRYDLWNDEKTRLETENTPEGRRFSLKIRQRESLLLFACASTEAWLSFPVASAPARRLTNGDFLPAGEKPDRFQKTYEAEIPEGEGDLMVSLDAEEMTEVYIGETCVGVAFWPPQEIRISERLLQGASRIRLVVTGSLANRYGHTPVFYGLRSGC